MCNLIQDERLLWDAVACINAAKRDEGQDVEIMKSVGLDAIRILNNNNIVVARKSPREEGAIIPNPIESERVSLGY